MEGTEVSGGKQAWHILSPVLTGNSLTSSNRFLSVSFLDIKCKMAIEVDLSFEWHVKISGTQCTSG